MRVAVNPCPTDLLRKIKYKHISSRHWDGVCSWYPSLATRTCLTCIVNAVSADVLATQGARTSAVMVFSGIFRIQQQQMGQCYSPINVYWLDSPWCRADWPTALHTSPQHPSNHVCRHPSRYNVAHNFTNDARTQFILPNRYSISSSWSRASRRLICLMWHIHRSTDYYFVREWTRWLYLN